MLLCWTFIEFIAVVILQMLTPPQPLNQDFASPLILCWSFIAFIIPASLQFFTPPQPLDQACASPLAFGS